MPNRPRSETPESLDVTRDARIEELLVSGLDEYFAGRYEQAINVWTRVVFLERGHSRARAYIERARGALAERQRESEELLHRGVEAYNGGQLETARDFFTRAVASGGPTDTALAFLDRLSRAGELDGRRPSAESPDESAGAGARVAVGGGVRWLPTAVASAGVAVAVLAGCLWVVSWFTGSPDIQSTEPRPAVEALPIVRSPELAVARARTLLTEGQPREALAVLTSVSDGDAAEADAVRLRAEAQRQLLSQEATDRPEAAR